MKKSWGNPIVQVQMFAPQEYCENCYRPITENGSWYATYGLLNNKNYQYQYIDLNKNNQYDVGERFSVGTGMSLAVIGNQTVGTVNVYGRYETTYFLGFPVSRTEYTSAPTGTPNYSQSNDFYHTNTFNVKIINNTAYYLPAGTNAS